MRDSIRTHFIDQLRDSKLKSRKRNNHIHLREPSPRRILQERDCLINDETIIASQSLVPMSYVPNVFIASHQQSSQFQLRDDWFKLRCIRYDNCQNFINFEGLLQIRDQQTKLRVHRNNCRRFNSNDPLRNHILYFRFNFDFQLWPLNRNLKLHQTSDIHRDTTENSAVTVWTINKLTSLEQQTTTLQFLFIFSDQNHKFNQNINCSSVKTFCSSSINQNNPKIIFDWYDLFIIRKKWSNQL